MSRSTDSLERTREFWDETPCDGQDTWEARSALRYGKDPWIPAMLARIAASHSNILEIGCGQGTDGIELCHRLNPGSRYTGLDMSPASLAKARAAAVERASKLRVEPRFQQGNAEKLPFEDGSFEAVLSVGVLHHTENTQHAIDEARRVLAPGGTAYILLYRTLSPKLLVAHALRGLQAGIDAITGADRSLYRLSRRLRPLEDSLGTALYECFGVPILRSYTASGMKRLFRDYASIRLSVHGLGLPPTGMNQSLERIAGGALGYLWLCEAKK